MREIVQVIKGVNDGGISIMLIEHIMEAVMSLSDSIVVISFGKKIAEGSAEEIAHNPQVQEAYFGQELDEDDEEFDEETAEGGDAHAES